MADAACEYGKAVGELQEELELCCATILVRQQLTGSKPFGG